VPEIGFRIREFHTNISLAVARTTNGNDAALNRLGRDVVNDQKGLANEHNWFEREECAMAVDRLRNGLRGKFFASVRFSVDGQWNRQSYAKRSPPFFVAKVQKGHFYRHLVLKSKRPQGSLLTSQTDLSTFSMLCRLGRQGRKPLRHCRRTVNFGGLHT
jgi:hypothetical protein